MKTIYGRAQGKILVDTASKGEIHDLHAPAYGKDRTFCMQYRLHQSQVETVCEKVCTAAVCEQFFAKKQGSNIAAAAEQKSITDLQVLRQERGVIQNGKDQRDSACAGDRLNVSFCHKLPVVR